MVDHQALLEGRHLIVTGGSSGIGLALVRRAAGLGARISVIALDDPALKQLAQDPPTTAFGAFPADVGDRGSAEAAVAAAVEQHGPGDVLVTCAGVCHPGYFTELPPDEFEREMRVNFFGTLWTVRAVVPSMMERRAGMIAAVSSFAGLLGVFGYGAYGPSKYAVRGLCETLRLELRPHGIHVAGVYPTDVDTPMLEYEHRFQPPEQRALNATVKPISADDVVDAILDGLARRRSRIFPGRGNGVLAHIIGAAPEVATRLFDRSIAKAVRQRAHERTSRP